MKISPFATIFLPAVIFITCPPVSFPDPGPEIKLAGYRFDPAVSVPAFTGTARRGAPSAPGYYILQFDGPVREEWKDSCRNLGVEFLDYIPDFAFIVRMTATVKEGVEDLSMVRWVGDYRPEYRLPEGLKNRRAAKKGGAAEYVVVVFPGADAESVVAGIEKEGGNVLKRSNSSWKTKLRITLSPDKLDFVASLPGVRWVEEAPVWRYLNNKGRGIMDAEASWGTGSCFGAGQVVGVADTGLDTGDTSTILDDLKDRVLAISNTFNDLTTGADVNGHGTHVSGSILGNGALSGAAPAAHSYPSTCYAGVAPEASLVFQALGNLTKIPNDLNVLFAQAYGGGARVHNNSWGSGEVGEYTASSEDVDEFSWDNKDFLLVFAAGNSGVDSNFDGVIDLYSVTPPATAKNCLSVGATENDRPPTSAPQPGKPLTYGWYWPADYPADPISDDYVSDDEDGMAAFSSRGCQLSARWKPELVAPGTNIVSCRTQAVPASDGILWGTGGLTGGAAQNYVFSGGTSMSSPLVCGAAALVRQYYTDVAGITPSAALIKATLINGAKDISPGQYGTGQYREIPAPPRPNNVEGWGRVDLGSTIFSASAPLDFYYYDVSSGLYTGSVHQYGISLSSSLAPLSVTLCWTDAPGSTPAAGALVNDLDFSVTAPNGTVYYPNNAVLAGPIEYENGLASSSLKELSAFEGMIEAVRFTPTCYPATLERGMFYLYSKSDSYSKTFQYRIYGGSGGRPGSLLASGTSNLRMEGWHIIDFSAHNITVGSGDLFLAIVLPDNDLAWLADQTEPIAGRSWEYMSGLGWYSWITFDYLFRAVVSCPTLYDRTNNTVGVDIDYPDPGNYTVTVSGYNVPYGPQPYALVASRPDRGVDLPEHPVIESGDYNGDGTSDIAIYRYTDGLWAVKGLTRVYFGGSGAIPVPGDYNGDGVTEPSIFRPESTLWAVRGVTRAYFGDDDDTPVPGDYNGDGKADIAVFREDSGLWAVRGLTRFYFGTTGDIPVPGDYDSFHPELTEAAVFRPSTGLWAIRNLARIYFGGSNDTPVPAGYDLLPGDDITVFRPAAGLWAVYDFGRFYYGKTGDTPVPADYAGQGLDDTAVFRPSTGLWAVKGVTRAYFGRQYDIPVTR
ncbi:MAG: S8 family serine peptidase [PVC group bacterium]